VEEDEIRRKNDLPEKILSKGSTPPPQTLKEREREAILTALQESQWNIVQSAESLGIHPSTLYRKMKRYGITLLDETN